jgi:hypothetical protein
MLNRFKTSWLLFYLLLAGIYVLLYVWHDLAGFKVSVGQAFLNNAWRAIYMVVVNFVFFEYMVPFVLRKKRFSLYNILWGILFLFLFMIAGSFGMYRWRGLGVALNIYLPLGEVGVKKSILASQMAFSMGALFFFGICRHIYKYVQLQRATQALLIEKQAAELNYLRAQTNPHFLFNTLNNIYSLARDKSDLAAESILRLSKILRFMLYETNGEYLGIGQEIKIIDDYIELEKLRYDETLQVRFHQDIEELKQAIPPLLLMPLVENAFKHGVSETRGRPFVDISLAVNNRRLVFVVKNSSENLPGDGAVKENIGLSNLRRQLELLYKDWHLSVEQGANVFTATLKINLASHV